MKQPDDMDPSSEHQCSAQCLHWRNAQTKRLLRELGWVRAALTEDGQPVALSRCDAEHVLRYLDSALAIARQLANVD